MKTRTLTILGLAIFMGLLAGCGGGGGGGGGGDRDDDDGGVSPPISALDRDLRNVIAAEGLTGDPTTGRNLPSINDPLSSANCCSSPKA